MAGDVGERGRAHRRQRGAGGGQPASPRGGAQRGQRRAGGDPPPDRDRGVDPLDHAREPGRRACAAGSGRRRARRGRRRGAPIATTVRSALGVAELGDHVPGRLAPRDGPARRPHAVRDLVGDQPPRPPRPPAIAERRARAGSSAASPAADPGAPTARRAGRRTRRGTPPRRSAPAAPVGLEAGCQPLALPRARPPSRPRAPAAPAPRPPRAGSRARRAGGVGGQRGVGRVIERRRLPAAGSRSAGYWPALDVEQVDDEDQRLVRPDRRAAGPAAP